MTDSLLSRLISLTGPDRDVDAEIALANGWKRTETAKGVDCWRDPSGLLQAWLPRYTASIDAALTLMPEGWDWNLSSANVAIICSNYDDDYARVFWSQRPPKKTGAEKRKGGFENAKGTVATPAIALLIAITRAKEERAT